MLNILRFFQLFSAAIFLVSCATTNDDKTKKNYEPGELDLIICQEPRPKICTREYNPVCATLKDGSTKTGSTACTSCSDPEVVGYKTGSCGIVSVDQ